MIFLYYFNSLRIQPLGCVCFGWEWNLENILHPNVCLRANVKLNQIENHFLWPLNLAPSTVKSFTHSIYLQTKFYRLKTRKKRERSLRKSQSEIHPNPNLVRLHRLIPLHAPVSTLFPFLPLFSLFYFFPWLFFSPWPTLAPLSCSNPSPISMPKSSTAFTRCT